MRCSSKARARWSPHEQSGSRRSHADHRRRVAFAAPEQLGSLFALVDRAGEGQLRLAEIAGLFWHCLADRGELTRAEVGQAVLDRGLAASAAPLRALLGEILKGAG